MTVNIWIWKLATKYYINIKYLYFLIVKALILHTGSVAGVIIIVIIIISVIKYQPI